MTLYAPLPPAEYHAVRTKFLTDDRARRRLGGTLPECLLAALSVETADLRKLGWSQPPAARKASYLRAVEALRPQPVIRKAQTPDVAAVCFVLVGKPLPSVEDTLRIGELMRIAVMSQCKHQFGEDRVPALFSGHGLPPGNRHRHAFYLPWDSNGDGRIDRILVFAPDGMDQDQQLALTSVASLWDRDGSEWRLALESIGAPAIAPVLTDTGTIWQSVTPYLHPWHVKKRFRVEDQIRRELRERGLPEPVGLESCAEVKAGRSRMRRPIHFRRFRSRRGLDQPDRLGSFWRLTFAEPLAGPLALGFACHFGLGLFRPVRD